MRSRATWLAPSGTGKAAQICRVHRQCALCPRHYAGTPNATTYRAARYLNEQGEPNVQIATRVLVQRPDDRAPTCSARFLTATLRRPVCVANERGDQNARMPMPSLCKKRRSVVGLNEAAALLLVL